MFIWQEEYVIHLVDDAQAVRLYGFTLSAKRTLTWPDVLLHRGISLRACIDAQIPVEKLHRVQPDIREWMRHGKATLADAHLMRLWRPHPFADLGCKVADLVIERSSLTPQVLIDGGVTFQEMCRDHGLTPKIMPILKYTPDDWVALEIDADFIGGINDEYWNTIFGPALSRQDLLLRVQRRLMLQASHQIPTNSSLSLLNEPP
jgi:hypothetical protein